MDCRGARVPVRSLNKQRVLAALVMAVLIVPAITECAGWAAFSADRHICCGNRGGMAPDTRMTDCCAMSEQASDATPPDAQIARPMLKLVDLQVVSFDGRLAAHMPTSADVVAAAHRAAVVPLYLRQASLLI